MRDQPNSVDSEFSVALQTLRCPFPKRLPPRHFLVARAEWSSKPSLEEGFGVSRPSRAPLVAVSAQRRIVHA